jgi:hypothetical protein
LLNISRYQNVDGKNFRRPESRNNRWDTGRPNINN